MNATLVDRYEPTLADAVPAAPRRAWLVANAVLLLVVAVLLRVWELGNVPGMNGDEAWSGVQALRLLHGEPIAWTTPTGNPINWFFLLPTAALHAIWEPSFGLLRVTSLISGLAALVVNYLLCTRAFDRRTAVISTLLLALAPINIAYSRFAWDTSQTLLATLFVLYLPLINLRREVRSNWLTGAAFLAFALAVLVHPTNLFTVPLLVLPWAWQHRRNFAMVLEHTAMPAKTWLFATLVGLTAAAAYLIWQWGIHVRSLHGPDDWGPFVANYLRLLSGTTVFTYISGADLPSAAMPWSASAVRVTEVAFWFVALLAVVGQFEQLARSANNSDAALTLGWGTMLVGFFIVAGPRAVAPHFERYGICLVAPAMLLMVRGLSWWLFESSWSRTAGWIAVLAGWLWAASFYVNYFEFIHRTGGQSHLTFRTAPIEPKQQALDLVLQKRDPARKARIVCDQWWNYWPIAYLAYGQANVEALTRDAWTELPPSSDQTWFVEFVDPIAPDELSRPSMAAKPSIPRQVIRDYAGRPLIVVVGPLEKSSQNY